MCVRTMGTLNNDDDDVFIKVLDELHRTELKILLLCVLV